jgi:hypothetical protein
MAMAGKFARSEWGESRRDDDLGGSDLVDDEGDFNTATGGDDKLTKLVKASFDNSSVVPDLGTFFLGDVVVDPSEVTDPIVEVRTVGGRLFA